MRKEYMWGVGIGIGCLALMISVLNFRHVAEHITVREIKIEPLRMTPSPKQEEAKIELKLPLDVPKVEVPQMKVESEKQLPLDFQKKLSKREKGQAHKLKKLELSLEKSQKKLNAQQLKRDTLVKMIAENKDIFEKDMLRKRQEQDVQKKELSQKQIERQTKEMARCQKKHNFKMKRLERKLLKEEKKLEKFQAKIDHVKKKISDHGNINIL